MTVCEVVAADIFVATVFIKVVAVAVSAILANIASASRSTHTHYNKENIVTSQHKEKKTHRSLWNISDTRSTI